MYSKPVACTAVCTTIESKDVLIKETSSDCTGQHEKSIITHKENKTKTKLRHKGNNGNNSD